MTMTPPPDPVSYIMDTVYNFNIYTTDLLKRVSLDVAENPTIQSTVDWIMQQKDQIAHGLEHLPNTINLSKVMHSQAVPESMAPPPAVSQGVWTRTAAWITQHKVLFGAIVLGVITPSAASYVYYSRKSVQAKRRKRHAGARRANNGARIEAIVLASSPREPLAKYIAADLERRGFIVFMTVQPGEEHLVLKEDSPDIRPLILPGPDAIDRSTVVNKFADLIDRQQHLAGVIILPDLYYPAGPVESINAYDWSDILYTKVVGSVALLSQGFIPLVRRHNARFIMLTPSIISSLCPPFHAPECVTATALSSFALCMQRELAPQGVPFIHMRLGSFEMSVPTPSTYMSAPASPFMMPEGGRGATTPSHVRSYSPATTATSRSVTNSIRADLLSWPENIRNVYGRAYSSAVRALSGTASSIVSVTARTSSSFSTTRGSPISDLNDAIFDALTSDSRSALCRMQFVGQGSFLYYVLGGILPEVAVEWVLGLTKTGTILESGSSYYRSMNLDDSMGGDSSKLYEQGSQEAGQGDHGEAHDTEVVPDSPFSSGVSGSPYLSETESTAQDLSSSWERV
ncbi:uncharacterized protein V1516DRAFT_669676 [Lipomyces oligophaga]|uniref:uncharacterized protein n=1 Tax=Lipomyces oligophaga TaxID=45792 RepID=UPI0034CFA68B